MEGCELWRKMDSKETLLSVKTPESKLDQSARETSHPSPDSSDFSQIADQTSTAVVTCGESKDVAKQRSCAARSIKSRSSFSVEQVLQLERVFERQKYLGSRDRQRIAEQLEMTETQVKTWFQNRRMKQKKKRAEDAERRAKFSFINSMAWPVSHGYQPPYECHSHTYPAPTYPAPTYPDTPLVLRSELHSKYACPPASPWSSLPPYRPPPPYWGRYPGTY